MNSILMQCMVKWLKRKGILALETQVGEFKFQAFTMLARSLLAHLSMHPQKQRQMLLKDPAVRILLSIFLTFTLLKVLPQNRYIV